MSIETGGPAFPYEFKFGDGAANRSDGMTLRDYLAARVLPWCLEDLPDMVEWAEKASESAYKIADAMLAERAK